MRNTATTSTEENLTLSDIEPLPAHKPELWMMDRPTKVINGITQAGIDEAFADCDPENKLFRDAMVKAGDAITKQKLIKAIPVCLKVLEDRKIE